MTLKDKIKKYYYMFEVQDRKGEDIVAFAPEADKKLKNSVKKACKNKLLEEWTIATYYAILSKIYDLNPKSVEDLKKVENKACKELIEWLNDFEDLSKEQCLAVSDIYKEVVNLLSE